MSAGIDSHKDTIHVAVITDLGVEVDDREFCTTQDGYRAAVAWLTGHGSLTAVGIEGTSSNGAGISAALSGEGVKVMEVNRTRPAERRKQGKSDRLTPTAQRVQSWPAKPPPNPSGHRSNPCAR